MYASYNIIYSVYIINITILYVRPEFIFSDDNIYANNNYANNFYLYVFIYCYSLSIIITIMYAKHYILSAIDRRRNYNTRRPLQYM